MFAINKFYNNTSIFYKILIDGRIFLTAIREEGTPASVLTITDKKGEGGPLLRPYPDWSWYRTLPMDGCDGIPGVVYGINVNALKFLNDFSNDKYLTFKYPLHINAQ